jgi:antitoxin ParD1/3/4
MAKNTSFTLNDHYLEFVENQVQSGRYASASEVIRDALRVLQDKVKLQQLRELIREGDESDIIEDFDPDQFLKNMREKYA